MLTIRKPRWFAIGLPCLLLLFGLNHLEYHLRVTAATAHAKPQVVVRAERGATGHNTIGIDESSVGGGNNDLFLHFATLGDWAFDPKTSTPCPAGIQALSGRQASCVGFMYPLEAGEKIKVFCLLRSTQTCCYGPRPQYNQYLFVEMPQPVKFERFAPVMIEGKFVVDPQPDQGFIYRMEGVSLTPAGDEGPGIDAAAAAQKAKLPRFDFQPMADMQKSKSKQLPAGLLALDGKQVVLDGFQLERSKDTPPHILVSNQWWDGVSVGTPPNLYNAVMVFPKDADQAPPLWQQKVVLTGTLRVEAHPADWSKQGIASLHEAVLGVPGTGALRGPLLPVSAECVLLAAFLLFAAPSLRSKQKSAG